MTRYSTVETSAKSAKASGSYLRVHFKNTREVAASISGKKLEKAVAFLKDVAEHKQAVPFRRFDGGIGRTAQGKAHGVTRARWPVKSVEFVLGLLKNAEANAEVKGLEKDKEYYIYVFQDAEQLKKDQEKMQQIVAQMEGFGLASKKLGDFGEGESCSCIYGNPCVVRSLKHY